MARTYHRDSRGRFTGGGSGGNRGPAKVGRAGPRGGKTGTKAEQRRAAKEQAARSAAFRSKATAGREARAAWKSAAGAARIAGRSGARNGIRLTGGLPRPATAQNAIKPGPRAGKTRAGGLNTDRQIKDAWRQQRREQVDRARWMARTQAQALADRLKGGVDAEIAGVVLKNLGGRLGRQQIQRRARRAARLAASGSKPAARALQLYDQQLTAMGPGKASRKGENNIKPGPRNANPEKKTKRKRSPRKPKR